MRKNTLRTDDFIASGRQGRRSVLQILNGLTPVNTDSRVTLLDIDA